MKILPVSESGNFASISKHSFHGHFDLVIFPYIGIEDEKVALSVNLMSSDLFEP